MRGRAGGQIGAVVEGLAPFLDVLINGSTEVNECRAEQSGSVAIPAARVRARRRRPAPALTEVAPERMLISPREVAKSRPAKDRPTKAPEVEFSLFVRLSEAPSQLPMALVMERLKPLLEDPAVLKIGHNFKYDWVMFDKHGIAVAPVDDTMLLSYDLDAGRHNHGLDDLAKLHFDHECVSFKSVCGVGAKQITFDKVPLPQATEYAAEDADITLRMWRRLKPRVAAEAADLDVEAMLLEDAGALAHVRRFAGAARARSSWPGRAMLQPAHPLRPLGVLPPQEGAHHQEQEERNDQPVGHACESGLYRR